MINQKHYLILIDLIRRIFQTSNCDILFEGTEDETKGFLGDVVYVKVTESENNTEHSLAIKINKNNPESIRIPFRNAFEREIIFYKDIMPFLDHLQKEKKLINPFNAVPKCYGTFLDDEKGVIILENLKNQGFELHQMNEPLNVNHLKIIFKNIAKFHALSFAAKKYYKDEFYRLTDNLHHVFRPKNKETYYKAGLKIVQQLHKANREDLARKYEKILEKGLEKVVLVVLDDEPEEKVVVHCDCHNNNMLFQYKDENKEPPSKMMILDFQAASLHSPAIDLSYLLYMAASKDEFPHFEELMKQYHQEVSLTLQHLGSDPSELFPISSLWQHWKRYSAYGFIMATLSLEVFYINKEEALLIRDTKNRSVLDNLTMLENNNKDYLERLVAVVDHYLNFQSEL